jgi:hypothetical protein
LKSKIQCDRKRKNSRAQDNWTFILLKTSRWVERDESEWTRMMLFIFGCEIHVRENVCHRFRPDGSNLLVLFKREYEKRKIENHEGMMLK